MQRALAMLGGLLVAVGLWLTDARWNGLGGAAVVVLGGVALLGMIWMWQGRGQFGVAILTVAAASLMLVPVSLWVLEAPPEPAQQVPVDALDVEPALVEAPPPTRSETVQPEAPSCTRADWHCRVFTWMYEGQEYTLALELDPVAYQAYRDQDKPYRHREENGSTWKIPAYDAYVTDPRDDAWLGALAARLAEMAGDRSPVDQLSFVLAFVQSLPYTPDDISTGYDEYPRFPLETLVDSGGDCEDSSILFASLAQALNFSVILISPPEHMAVGVAVDTPQFYEYQGRHYAYAETTGDDWPMGVIPDIYQGVSVEVFDLVPGPLFDLEVTSAGSRGSVLTIHAEAHHTGTAPGTVGITAWIRNRADQTYGQAACSAREVLPGGYRTCDLPLDFANVPRGMEVQVVIRVHDQTYWYDQRQGQFITPYPN